jgi:cation diffusion facilitator family transporter
MTLKTTTEKTNCSCFPATKEIRKVTVCGLAVNLVLAAIKFTAGIFGSSQALVADSVHSLSDSSTDIAILIGAPYWSAPADAKHPYGHGRIETLITVLIGISLVIVGVGIAYKSLASLNEPHPVPPGWIALIAAGFSMASKEWLYRWTVRVGKRVRSEALIANAWHHRSDGLSSLPVALAVLGVRLRPDWFFLDHVAAMIVSVLILQASWKIIWPSLNQLADAGGSYAEQESIRAIVMKTEGVKEMHALRTRKTGPGLHVDLHILVDSTLTVKGGHDIARRVKGRLLENLPAVTDVLVHVEPSLPGFEKG